MRCALVPVLGLLAVCPPPMVAAQMPASAGPTLVAEPLLRRKARDIGEQHRARGYLPALGVRLRGFASTDSSRLADVLRGAFGAASTSDSVPWHVTLDVRVESQTRDSISVRFIEDVSMRCPRGGSEGYGHIFLLVLRSSAGSWVAPDSMQFAGVGDRLPCRFQRPPG